MALVFYVAGHLCSEEVKRPEFDKNRRNMLYLSVATLCVLFSGKINGYVNMSSFIFNNMLYYYFFAFVGIFVTMKFSKILSAIGSGNRIGTILLSYIGKNSMIIFGLHWILINFVSLIMARRGLEENYNVSIVPRFFACIAIILFILAIVRLRDYVVNKMK